MRIDIITIFPEMVERTLSAGVLGRARERGIVTIVVHDLRDFTVDRHRVVDDVPYGGGPGMVLKPEPIFRALEAIEKQSGRPASVILTSPQGVVFSQAEAHRLSEMPHLVLLCGRYEGVDERVKQRVTEEISIGDYVLSGGELPALVIVDAIARLIPGVVGDDQSLVEESFSRGLLDFPQYTRPAEIPAGTGADQSLKVPGVLLSGNHAEIRRWRKREALSRTLDKRPDLLESATLDEEERAILSDLTRARANKGVEYGSH